MITPLGWTTGDHITGMITPVGWTADAYITGMITIKTEKVPAHAEGAGSRQACSGIRLLLLLLILREAKLADVTPCPGHHVRRHACRGERVPARNDRACAACPEVGRTRAPPSEMTK